MAVGCLVSMWASTIDVLLTLNLKIILGFDSRISAISIFFFTSTLYVLKYRHFKSGDIFTSKLWICMYVCKIMV